MVTLLLVEWSGDAPQLTVGDAVSRAGGSVTSSTAADDGGRHLLVAEFPLAMDATHAALQIVQSVADSDATVRMALWTSGGAAGGVDEGRAMDLLRQAGPGQILTSASTAVLVGSALPADMEFVEAGSPAGGRRTPSERAYHLRPLEAHTTATYSDESGDPGHPDRAASNLAWAHRAAGGPLFDRQEPMAILDAAWQSTLRGNRSHVLLAGESGIGKTALAAELALRTHARGALVLYGRWDREQAVPYQAVREALGTYGAACPTTQLRDDLDAHADAICRLLPDIAARLGEWTPPPIGDPEGERLGLYDAVVTWLDRLATQRPVLVVLDDLQWAERSSRLLVDHLHQVPGTAPWMLLSTRRSSEVDPAGRGADHHVELRGLDFETVADLACYALGAPLEADDPGVLRLTTETAGNPLFVHHVLRSVPDAAGLDLALRATGTHLPDQLRDVIGWRLSQLPSATRRLLATAAAIGPTFGLDLLADATDRPYVLLRETLEPAIDEALVRPEPGTDDYYFTHEVVRRTLYDDSQPRRSAQVHRQIAAALEARAARGLDIQPTEIAYHHLRGADADTAATAVRWARLGAEAARRATGFDEAAELLLQAVAVHDQLGNLDDQHAHGVAACQLSLDLAEAHDLAGQFTARDERFAEAAAMSRELQRTDLFARAALGFGGHLPSSPPPDPTARSLLEEALENTSTDDSVDRALLIARLAHIRHFDAPYDVRRELADHAVSLARRLDSRVALADVLTARCFALEGPDNVDEYLSIGNEVERIGVELDDPDLRLQGFRLQAPALLSIGQHREAREVAAAHAHLARQIRHQEHVRLATLWDVLWTWLGGDGVGAQAVLEELVWQLTAAGHPQAGLIHFVCSFGPRWLQGEVERSRPGIDAFRTTVPSWTVWWAWSIWLDAETGHEDDALARLDDRDPVEVVAGVEHDSMWWPTMISLATGAGCGRPSWARAVRQALLPYAGRLCVTGYALFLGAVDHHLGRLALVLDEPDEAVDRLESGLLSHRALGAPPFVALSTRTLARALASRAAPGDRERASTLQAEADTLADRFGLHGLTQDRASRNA